VKNVAGPQGVDWGDGKGGLVTDLPVGSEPGSAAAVRHCHPRSMHARKPRYHFRRLVRAKQFGNSLRRESGMARKADEGLVLRGAVDVEDARNSSPARLLEVTPRSSLPAHIAVHDAGIRRERWQPRGIGGHAVVEMIDHQPLAAGGHENGGHGRAQTGEAA
jgi:hypothetical protein